MCSLKKKFLNCFEKSSYICSTCGCFSHNGPTDGLHNTGWLCDRESAAKLLREKGIDTINLALRETNYQVEHYLDERTFESDREFTHNRITDSSLALHYDRTKKGHMPFAMRYESSGKSKKNKTKKIREKVIVDSYEQETNEPIYETAYKEETYQERVSTRVPVQKTRTVVTPYTKRINKPMINRWVTPNRWEDRYYTESYQDIKYEHYTDYEDKITYVNKKRTVPYQKQTGTRKVTKTIPIYDTREQEVSYTTDSYTIKTHLYYLLPVNPPCSKCTCPRCRGFLFSIGAWFRSLFCCI